MYSKILLTYVGFLIATLAFLIVVKSLNIAYPLTITTKQASGELAVTGEGKADVVSDSGEVTASITVSNVDTQKDAQDQMNKVNDAIIAAVKDLGINKTDIQTTNYSINPHVEFTTNGQKAGGFDGNAQVTITVKDFSKVSQVIDAVTNAGATNVNSNGGQIQDSEKYREMARDKAIENAKNQAQKLASELGIHLGPVVNIVEGSPDTPGPVMFSSKAMPMVGGGAPTTIEPGSQTITSTVTLYFERQ